MTTQIQAALDQLNAATQRAYAIDEEGEQYTLLAPGGGRYNAVGGVAMLVRLVTLRIAADGRQCLRAQRSPCR